LPDDFDQAAWIIREAKKLVILLGPELLYQYSQDNSLEKVERYLEQTGAAVILLPAEGNLTGALSLQLPPARSSEEDAEVIFYIGEDIPEGVPGSPFIIYQNIYPSLTNPKADLVLPATPFSEENGTITNHAGHVQQINKAVEPLAESLPVWEVLSRLARQMAIAGFDYTCVEDIQAEIALHLTGFAPGGRIVMPERSNILPVNEDEEKINGSELIPARPVDRHIYMGFPLERWVEGFKMLLPGAGRPTSANRRNGDGQNV
jgi:NADH dehydrogenase/NADH:ubiquinone oxidoreductase subunit G